MAKGLTENMYFDELRTLADPRIKRIMNQNDYKNMDYRLI
jgi:hypothetical protein